MYNMLLVLLVSVGISQNFHLTTARLLPSIFKPVPVAPSSGGAVVPTPKLQFALRADTDCKGQDITEAKAFTPLDCEDVCIKTINCTVFTFTHDNRCLMKYDCTDPQVKKGERSYLSPEKPLNIVSYFNGFYLDGGDAKSGSNVDVKSKDKVQSGTQKWILEEIKDHSAFTIISAVNFNFVLTVSGWDKNVRISLRGDQSKPPSNDQLFHWKGARSIESVAHPGYVLSVDPEDQKKCSTEKI